jgi:hypothetical protein
MINHINKKMQKSLPVKVTKVSSDRKFVNVQPQILVVDSEGGTIIRGEIKGIPVVTSGASNFLISFDISVGDLGWIEASDRDISLFKQSYEQSKPNTKRMHNFSDARFVPDIMTNFVIAEEDAGALVIQNRDGSVKISLNSSRIKMQSPSDIEINGAKITPSGDVVTASGVSLDNHPHNQSNDGGGNTEQPTDAPTATE